MKLKRKLFVALLAITMFLFPSCFGLRILGGYGYGTRTPSQGSTPSKESSTEITTDGNDSSRPGGVGNGSSTADATTNSGSNTTTTKPSGSETTTGGTDATDAYNEKQVTVFYSNAFSSYTTLTFYPAAKGLKRVVYKTVYNGKETTMEGTYDLYPLPETNLNISFADGDGYNALCTETGKILYVPGLGSFNRQVNN